MKYTIVERIKQKRHELNYCPGVRLCTKNTGSEVSSSLSNQDIKAVENFYQFREWCRNASVDDFYWGCSKL